MGYITRLWPQGLVLFLQPARMNPFGRARPDEPVRTGRKVPCRGGTTRPLVPEKNNKQKRITAAAAPDALKVSAWA
jgi:hypothetical protein